MVTIVFSKIARTDLKEVVDYIKRDSVKYAFLERKKIIQAIDKLRHQPYLGKPLPEISKRHHGLVFQNYLIIYKIAEKQIEILTVHHHARSLTTNPAFNDED